MKYPILVLVSAMAAAVLALNACQDTKAPVQTKVYAFEDSTAHASMKFSAELPCGTDRVSKTILEDLKVIMDEQLGHIASYEGERQYDAYDGEWSDTEAFVKYYFDKTLDILARESDKDARDRELYMTEEAMDDAEREDILSRMPGWEYEFNLSKADDTEAYTVFHSQDYIYMGGAHGGVTGAGSLTYDKKTGERIEAFLDPDCVEDIQPLIRKGLTDYFTSGDMDVTEENLNDFLLLDGDLIPLPSWQPFPSKDGLVFTYQQYEIAPYAEGMPAFTIPYEDIAPYVLVEVRPILGL